MTEEEFTFDIQDYLKVDSRDQHELNGQLKARLQEIDTECQSDPNKSEKQQRELKAEIVESDSTLLRVREGLEKLAGNQYSEPVRRGGIVCCSNIYGLVYIAKKCDLYVIPIANIETRADILPVKSFPTDIKQIGISTSELYLSVTLDESIDIFESRSLNLDVSGTIYALVCFMMRGTYLCFYFVVCGAPSPFLACCIEAAAPNL